tara:strand:- start:32972 stop:34837 length:1866 start_codon:yes stop_codon:yes gene_type:complete
MCGIAGILSNRRDLRPSLNQMILSMHHRGPDFGSFKVFENLGLAHTRLSIIDLSESGNQPMEDEEESIAIVFNGEIYNYQELKSDLQKKGINFKNSSDTEVLLNGYKYEGLDFFKKIRGFYSLAIYDSRNKSLLLTRDAFGKKPLYYSFIDGEFIFASELKTIISQLTSIPDPNYEALSHYLWKGYFANGMSIYNGIHSLNPGDGIIVNTDSFQQSYIKVLDNIKIEVNNSSQARSIEVIENELREAVDYRMIADVPISFLLSGGIDSSLVSYLGSQNNTLDTYYLGYGGSKDIFMELSQFVSKMIKSNHHTEQMNTPNFEDSIDNMINLFDEPFADYSALPSFEIYKSIRKSTKVAISGDGADEIFGGYKDVRTLFMKSLLPIFPGYKSSQGTVDKIFRITNSQRKSLRYLAYALGLVFLDEGSFVTTLSRGGWNHDYRKRMMTNDGYKKTLENNIETTEIADYFSSGDNPVERFMNYDLKRLTYDFLVKVDRTSMANSLEVRSPFLDIKMINSIGNTNPSSMTGIFDTKKELKTILDSRGFAKLTKIPKQGFTPPLAKWMLRREGIVELEKIVESEFISSLFNKKHLSEMISSDSHISKNYFRLWVLLILDKWFRNNYS